ncbi:thermonuclease family protein [Argonema antarcticum]|uniref:thermonuclease family protein n=1 Tax=Argonema antarcticum TaxID=2942763 RepID=UPI0020116588|nr:thermonuclease family protein [Argonema antarcticum]MCL1473031.1 thermonuclease family protein [Argonema antarcticum A004/B2]
MSCTRKLIKNSLKCLGVGFLIVSLTGCPNRYAQTTYSVKRVSDGDTIAVTDSKGTSFTVRFACADAPEIPHSQKEKQSRKLLDKNQFNWGVKAQSRVRQLVKKGGDRISLTITDTDRYGRKIGEVRLPDGTFIQQVLIREGLAMVYQPYLKNCPSASVVQEAEAEAKKSRRGIWGDANFVPAWEYRRTK